MLAAAESWGVPVLLAGKGVGDAEVETWESVAAAGTDDVGEGCDDGAECRLWDTLALRAAKEGGCARCWVSATRSATQASTFCNWRPSARVRKLLMMSTRSPFLIDALSAETTCRGLQCKGVRALREGIPSKTVLCTRWVAHAMSELCPKLRKAHRNLPAAQVPVKARGEGLVLPPRLQAFFGLAVQLTQARLNAREGCCRNPTCEDHHLLCWQAEQE
eukprot:scaffold31505_cov15-Tisochrysis_lutea.AAC.2